MPATWTQAGGILLRDALPQCQISPRDLRATSCCSDPHRCRPGDVFVALCGDEYDGHDFAYAAIERGAVAVVAERMLPVGVPLCLVPDSREAYGRICQALVDHPTRAMTTIGVAGTHGKTTVAKLLTSVLRAAGARVGAIDSLACSDGTVAFEGQRPTAAPELAHWTAEMQAAGCTHCVLEIDSLDLAQRRSAALDLDAAVLTNIRHGAANQHRADENLQTATRRIYSQLKPGGFAVINVDDRGSQRMLGELDCPTMTVALHADAEVTATIVEQFPSEQTVLLSAGDDIIPLRTKMVGEQHAANCLSVAAAALALDIDLPTIVRGLEAVESIPLRLERIECGQPFGVFLDVADSPDRLASCLRTMRQVTDGRVICVANADGDGPRDHRPLIGRVLEKHAALGLITTSNVLSEPALHSIHDVIDGYQRPAKAHAMPDREQAIAWALSQAKPGDCVLIAGCRDHQRINREAEVVREWLRDDQQDDAEQTILRIH